MITAAATAVAAAAGGLCIVRTATPLARWLAWGVVLAFAAIAFAAPEFAWRQQDARAAAVTLAGEPRAIGGELLLASSRVSPGAVCLQMRWRDGAVALPAGSLGAVALVPAALPFQPEDLHVAALTTPMRGRPLSLQVRALDLPSPLAAELRIVQGGQVVQRTAVNLGTAATTVSFLPANAGPHSLELVATAGACVVTAAGAFDVVEPASVLVLEPSGLVAEALRAQGVQVEVADTLPADPRAHAAVVLGRPLPAADQERLAVAVRDGLGAFVLAPAFGAAGEPLRSLLPLRPYPQQPDATAQGNQPGAGSEQGAPPPVPPPVPPRIDEPPRGDTAGAGKVGDEPIEVDKHAIAMVLVVDRSGSMGTPLGDGNTKMSYAKTSALRTAQALGEGDRVGIVTFGNKDKGQIVLPLTDAANLAVVREGIGKLAHAREHTYLLGGLRKAYDMLAGVDAAVKHVVVISDGEFDVNEELAMRKLANQMRETHKVTLSLIAIVDGDTDSTFLKVAEGLRAEGGGEFLQTRDPGNVPAFVSAEVTRSLQRVGRKPRTGQGAGDTPSPSPEPPKPAPPEPAPPQPPPPRPVASKLAVRAVAESPLLDPVPALAWPSLARAVAGTAPLDARVLLVAGDDGWPLLAFGNRGLGRVGAFASDLCGAAGAEFRAEPAFPARVAQWVQSVLPSLPEPSPRSLLTTFAVQPPLPTPRDVQALAALGGAMPIAPEARSDAPPGYVREAMPGSPEGAPWLLGLLVLLAAGERWLASRALQRAS